MATASKEFDNKMCYTCAPKTTVAITSCHGCHHHFCRKHFNEHRDQLSKYLNNNIDLHDEILQDLKTRIDHSSKDQLNNDNAKTLLRQIDTWEERTINACHHAAAEARSSIKNLFDKTEENNSLTVRLSSVAKELEERQQSENFVEHDLDRWMKQLEDLRNDINQRITFPADIILETRDIDWEESIKICQLPDSNKNVKHYVLLMGEKGVGKTTFIDYVANFIANKRSYSGRLLQEGIELNQKEIVVYSHDSKQRFMFNRYAFPIDDKITLVFLDPLSNIMDEGDYAIEKNLSDLYGIHHFTSVIFIGDGTSIEENPDWNDLTQHCLERSEILPEYQDSCKQFLFVATNCPPYALNFNCSTVNILDNISFYFMQNSAYQLFRAPSTTDSVETDFRRAMETMEQIIKKIVDEIHRQA